MSTLQQSLEPEASVFDLGISVAATVSIAISLKRLADGNAAVAARARLKRLVNEIEGGLDLDEGIADGGYTARQSWTRAAYDALDKLR